MTLKSLFNPSAEVSAARRLKTFGTESKAVAGAAIVAGAGLAIGGGLIAGATGLSAAAKKGVTSLVAKTTLKGAAKAALVAPVAIGTGAAIIKDKETRQAVTNTLISYPKQAVGFSYGATGGVIDIAKGETKQGFNKIIQSAKDNPLGATAAGITLGAAAGFVGYQVIKGGAVVNTLMNKETKMNETSPLGVSNAPLSDVQTKLVSESEAQKASGLNKSSAQPSISNPGAYNIQQNNYYSEKYIKKFIHNV